MEDAGATAVVERLVQASGVKNAATLANILGVTAQAISHAKKRGQIPPTWIFAIAGEYHVATDWLLFGRGEMRPGVPQAQTPAKEAAASCNRCFELHEKLGVVNDRLYSAMKEISDLKDKNVALEKELEFLKNAQSESDGDTSMSYAS